MTDKENIIQKLIPILREWDFVYRKTTKIEEMARILLKIFKKKEVPENKIVAICGEALSVCKFYPTPFDLLKIYEEKFCSPDYHKPFPRERFSEGGGDNLLSIYKLK